MAVLVFLFNQNGDVYRTAVMCIVAAIAYIYQVRQYNNIRNNNNNNNNIDPNDVDEDGFQRLPPEVVRQQQQEDNIRRQRNEQQHNNNDNHNNTQQPPQSPPSPSPPTPDSWLINTEKYIVGYFASLFPEWKPDNLTNNYNQ